jgi:orotate phosphoribosyltransferase
MSGESTFHEQRMPDPRPSNPRRDPDLDADVDAARALASDLLTIGAVALRPDDPFTWSSGLKAPIYCDNRKTLAYPRGRRAICDGFVREVGARSMTPATIAGTATAGIPHAAWLADRLDAPLAYVRSAAKRHGQRNRIEGVVEEGDTVVVIEDLISTGQSALSAVEALREKGAVVRAVLAIFSYELDRAATAFRDAEVPLYALTGFSTLLDVAITQDDLSRDQVQALRTWRTDPQAWSASVGGEDGED